MMPIDPTKISKLFNKSRVNDRQINELLGLCHGITADGKIHQNEAEFLHKWLVANSSVSDNPIIATLLSRISGMLKDGFLDKDESADLYDALTHFTGGKDWEVGELLKSTTLPIDQPPRPILFQEKQFCFTGMFAYGSRSDCESAVKKSGGFAGNLTLKTDYLVIGLYATDSWIHSSYGRKIEKAVEMKQKGRALSIVHEPHWLSEIEPYLI